MKKVGIIIKYDGNTGIIKDNDNKEYLFNKNNLLNRVEINDKVKFNVEIYETVEIKKLMATFIEKIWQRIIYNLYFILIGDEKIKDLWIRFYREIVVGVNY